MDSDRPLLIPLDKLEEREEQIVGGKAAKLGQLARVGFTVPNGVCLTTWAYEEFINEPWPPRGFGISGDLSAMDISTSRMRTRWPED